MALSQPRPGKRVRGATVPARVSEFGSSYGSADYGVNHDPQNRDYGESVERTNLDVDCPGSASYGDPDRTSRGTRLSCCQDDYVYRY